MSPIKDMKLAYLALNEMNVFTAGDTIAGTLTFTLTEDTKVKSLSVKAKGRAHVHWTDGTGDRRRSHTANRIYFKAKHTIVEKKSDDTVLSKGDYCHKFSLQIPQGDFPPSFKGFHGKVVYTLEAKLSRSLRIPSFVQEELRFIPKSFLNIGQCPVSGSVEKGKVKMFATVDKKVCCPGDTLSVVAKISNSSSKKMKPKFSVMQRITYRAHASTNHSYQTYSKWVGETIESKSEETVSCKLTVPADAIYTINNCDIIIVEYFVKAYLDISFAIDPEVLLPVIVYPPAYASHKYDEAMGPHPAGPAGASYSDFPPPAFSTGPYPVPVGPGAPFQPGPYPAGAVGAPGYSNFPPPGPYPAPTAPVAYGYPAPIQPAPTTSGFSNQWPQQVPPYGYPPAAFQPQAPTAPPQPQLQEGENPPNYASLFPPST
ncbi:arrestin domain-containing protein 3-like [Cheilinus undulatus]|uniref:arrestin domain-containing protein 3-like n=1 Tax=Cheilinus undulatus TaxID=241271 RepID=UPI001BD47A55|nr:arrestin domain-containing protein 3-like [Cheilinus undulatus]